jgi:hypothetical protein
MAVDSLIEGVAALAAKWWPTFVGALVSMRFQPPESTRIDRAFSAASGVGLSMFASPAIVDWAGVTSIPVAQGIGGAVALFGLIVVAEIIAGIKGIEAPKLLRDFVRKLLRLDP